MGATDLTFRAETGAFTLDVALDFDDGWTAVFGPSGSGKTTLLDCVAGLRRPRQGRVVIGGVPVYDSERGVNLPARHRRVGYVSQEGHLFPHLTVRQNLRFGCPSAPQADAPLTLDEVAAMLEVGDLLDRHPSSLSGGQRQRVALGRALLSAPRLLLLDEPLSSLDVTLRQRVMTCFERVRAQVGVACLYVTHDIGEVLRLADRVALISGGRISGCAPPSSVLASLASADTLEQHAEGLETVLELDVAGHDPDDGVTRLSLGGDQVLRVPLVPHQNEARVRVALRADDVILAIGPTGQLSAQNAIAATVTEIVDRGNAHYVRCAIEGQHAVWSHITPAALRRMALTEGTGVTLIVKSHSVRRP
ncbi:MAG: molybdenum ABC transporter ATP-binding protein [Proteobacteria bacterium]|nr:molybdenum ABC transporter ATP-binding protein [Pseudomonadota bacterium]